MSRLIRALQPSPKTFRSSGGGSQLIKAAPSAAVPTYDVAQANVFVVAKPADPQMMVAQACVLAVSRPFDPQMMVAQQSVFVIVRK